MCMPCSIPYTHIVHIDTFAQDVKCLLNDMGLTQVTDDQSWVAKQYTGERTENTLNFFYSKLNPEQLMKLWAYYFYDHALFDFQFIQPSNKTINFPFKLNKTLQTL